MTKILDINDVLDIIAGNKQKFCFTNFGSEALLRHQQHKIEIKSKKISASFHTPFLLESSVQEPFEMLYETYWETVFEPEF